MSADFPSSMCIDTHYVTDPFLSQPFCGFLRKNNYYCWHIRVYFTIFVKSKHNVTTLRNFNE